MSRNIPLPSPKELREEFAMQETTLPFVSGARDTVKKILDGEDSRHLLIVGPCSIHDVEEAKEYAQKLKRLSEQVKNSFYIIMRTYFEKPRTTIGWKGLLFDPKLDGTHDIAEGMRYTRKLFLELANIEIPTAAEFLAPTSPHYFGDLITWGCIGARTSESQTHREIASGLPLPIAFKNNTDGNASVAVNGAVSASQPHTFIGINDDGHVSAIHTQGNPYSHIVLRGGCFGTNYDPASISSALNILERHHLKKRLIIDCSHDNAGKEHLKQIHVFQSVIHQILEGNHSLVGMILESNLHAGNQQKVLDHSPLKYGVSITDPCLDWETTEELILWGHQRLQSEIHSPQRLATYNTHATNTLSC